MTATTARPSLAHRLMHEVKQYLAVSFYLYICLGAFAVYKSALMRSEGITYLPFGIAAVKALILGKFMMVGHALKLGQGGTEGPLIFPILRKSLVFLVLLFALNMIEEIVAGLIHHRSVAKVVEEVTGGTLLQTVAVCLLFFLILLPYFAFREVGEALGEGRLWRLMFRGDERPAE
ncbi:MAG: hypothetical protein U1E70_21945 [Acetobacteraceae bacterium]